MKKFPLPLPPEVQQFSLLTRHFFNRLFLNDLVAFEEQMKERVIAGLAFLAIFSAHLSNVALFKYSLLPELRTTQPTSLLYLPSLWFVGLYETWLGTTDPFFLKLRWLALLALLLPSLAFFLTMGFGYQRQLKKPGKSKRTKLILPRPKRAFSRILHWLWLRHPLQRAVFYFYQAGLKRSPPHRLRLISYLAVATALALVVMGIGGSHGGARSLSDNLLFSLTFILCFFTLVAVRTTVTLPITHEANWVWRLTEKEKKHHYFSGLRQGLLFFPLLPLFVLLLLFYSFFWEWSKVGLHGLFSFVTAWLLAEGLFLRFQKIPFTCSFMPGKAKIQYFWLVYLAGFLAYVNFFSWLEGIFSRYPDGLYIYFGVAAGLIAGVRLYQHLLFYRRAPLIYEEKLEMVMITLETE